MSSLCKTAFIFTMCVLDCVLSWWGVQAGYLREANVVLAPLMQQPLVFPFLIKNGYTLALLVLLLRLEKRSPALVGAGLNLIALIYTLVTAIHFRYLYWSLA